MSKVVHIIGFPMDLGADRRGVDMGPSALRIAGVGEKLRALGYEIIDEGDIPIKSLEVLKIRDEKLKYLPEITRAAATLAKKVEQIADKEEFPLVLGGDHSMAIGTIAGLAASYTKRKKTLGVIWIDAHSDINTPKSSPSGNIHGMPLAVCLGIGVKELTSVGGEFRKVAPENVALIGLRSIDPEERTIIKNLKLNAFTMSDIDKLGASRVIARVLKDLRTRVDHIHVSFDLDSVDPTVAQGVGTPVRGGLSFRETHLIMEMIADCGCMSSMEVAEVNPILDNRNQSAEFAAELIASSMGKRIL